MTEADPQIQVDGYSRRYAAAVNDLLQDEGGLVDDPVDRGGVTKYGISLRFLAAEGAFDEDADGRADFDLDSDGDIDGRDVRLLTHGDAIFLYLKCFWRPLGCERLPVPIGEMVFDHAVNGGRTAAVKLLQRALNTCTMEFSRQAASFSPLKVDGVLGELTIARIAWSLQQPAIGLDRLVEAYRDAVRERYRQIVARYPAQQRFLRGWLARAERLGR